MTEPFKIPKPGRPSVRPKVEKARKPKAKTIVEGAGGRVSTNSIGQATSVAGSRPFGKPVTRIVYPMSSGPDVMGGDQAHA